ncbi:hypothetical protein M8C21_006782 [Ambrosia artemisiifolia]|uniref:Uncharacterized protein n=1 Tax=Ambrosia artemisiifolia TaxID=4212 RepID=A0AAD5D4L5_AMBAR|nr:hypothetical protein M8C21_006782 [Ambrosia artemisiifolia]
MLAYPHYVYTTISDRVNVDTTVLH